MLSRTIPVPFTTDNNGSSAQLTGTLVRSRMIWSIPLSILPPPVIIIPLSKISEANSGGVLSSAFLTASTIMLTVSFNACRISSEDTSIVFGIPLTKSRPLTVIVPVCIRMAEPTDFLMTSLVGKPISNLCSLRNHCTIASSISSPAMRIVSLVTTPFKAITAISVVPPPISTIILPMGLLISSPIPIAAATGSSIKNTSLAFAL